MKNVISDFDNENDIKCVDFNISTKALVSDSLYH